MFSVLVLCCFIGMYPAKSLCAAVEVETNDGRLLSGEIDHRSDENHLWVRMEQEAIVLATSIAWSDVRDIKIEGTRIEVTEVQAKLRELVTKGPRNFLTEYEVQERQPEVIQAVALVPTNQFYVPRVTTIEIDAILVNLDRDVEPDGFEVYLSAFDQRGGQIEVRGNVYARLMGQRSELHGSPVQFVELQRWSTQVRQSDFVEGVATFPLQFRTVRPEFDFKLWPDALLNIRLGVPGQGNFEATVPVNLRYFNPYRDRLQVYEGSRFFRGELSEDVRQNGPQLFHSGRGIRSW